MKNFSKTIRKRINLINLSAFSLVEMMIVVSILITVIMALVAVQIFAMRVYTTAATKLVATSGARKAMNQMRDQIRSAKSIDIGTCSGDYSTFVATTNGLLVGNALRLFPTTNLIGPYLVCYLETNQTLNNGTNRLKLYNSAGGGSNTATLKILASFITNTTIFDVEDFQGNTLSNNQNNRTIKMTLQFYQW